MDSTSGLTLWTEILTRGSSLPPTEAAIRDLIEYSGLPEDEVRYLAANSQSITAKKWAEADRSTPEGLRAFYSGVTSWVFGTLSYHARQAEQKQTPLPVQAAIALADRKPGAHLDFGCGVATANLLFARLGWQATAADVAPPLLDFARWRFAKFGVDAKVIDLNTEALPPDSYDLITAFNTMVHVDKPSVALRNLHAALKPGGLLVFDIDSRKKSGTDQWFLYDSHAPILSGMRRLGFARRKPAGVLYIYEKVEASPLQREFFGVVDSVRYSRPVNWFINKLRGLKGRIHRLGSRLAGAGNG
jgi:SAM-dependent methyltransferase